MKLLRKSTTISRACAIVFAVSLCGYVLLANTAPLGLSMSYADSTKAITPLSPRIRVQQDGRVATQTGNLTYFSVNSPFSFDRNHVKLKIKNESPQQTISLGYRDKEAWHYSFQTISAPFIDQLRWSRVGKGPYLYQKQPVYEDPRALLADPPKDKFIGVYDYDSALLKQETADIPGYKPAGTDTVINMPFRGKITMYVYLNNEPFNIKLEKRDLNWYEDPDPVNVKIYKQSDKVMEVSMPDDGIVEGNKRLGALQYATIKNPGPDMPEAGVYKMVIDAQDDTVITKITTNLHKVIFEGPLYVADNSEAYPGLTKKTNPSVLFTNAQSLTAQTHHAAGLQTIMAGAKTLPVTKVLTLATAEVNSANSVITMPKSDIILNGSGYFSVTQDQFFQPSPYRVVQISTPEDLARVDYLLTNYKAPKALGDGWYQVDRELLLQDAVTQKGKLSWSISAPGLEESKRTISIKDIEMTLTKDGWFTH